MNQYQEFIQQKSQLDGDFGFEPEWLPSYLFDFQTALVEWAVRKGRAAIFADCGTGKSVMELVWAQNVYQHTGKPVLILTPLAVGAQFVREAEHFKIDAARSRRGEIPAPIVITNYERLHLFDADQFGGAVCDECFVGDTPIDTLEGIKRIADVRPGEYIYTASGLRRVKGKTKRYKKTLVLTSIQSYDIISSENHPFFTQQGWVKAKDLTEGDHVIYTTEAMRMVRESSDGKTEENRESFLREILLSEMEDEPTGDSSKGSYPRSTRQNREEKECLVQSRVADSPERTGANQIIEPHVRPSRTSENLKKAQGNRAQTTHSRRKRSAHASSPKTTFRAIGERLARGVRSKLGKKAIRVSDELQNRHSEPVIDDCNRSGRVQPYSGEAQETGRQEGREVAGVRVDRVTIYEQSNPIFDRYRDETGRVALYDLEVKGHPSYSVYGLLVHNSSILKSFDGVRRKEITEFMRLKKYRLLGTATAAPNDYIELGTSSEALGYLGYMDMLGRFFTNRKRTSRQMKGRWRDGRNGWRFKGHAEQSFWRWVSSWARALRYPSDLGYDDNGFVLPPLNIVEHIVEAPALPGMLFPIPAVGWREQRAERKHTITERCQAVADLVNHTKKPAVVWCAYNAEGDLLERLIPDAQQVSGRDKDESKEEKLESFTSGETRVLVTKPKIGAWGLNWQHCDHLTWFPSYSYEQYYQATRRCWRFGQQSPVTVDIVMTEGQRLVQQNLQKKADAAAQMFSSLVKHMGGAVRVDRLRTYDKDMEVPSWL